MNKETNRIRFWRQAKGWSLQQLADAIGTSKSQIDKLEKGDRRLSVDWMVRLAKPLECDPRELLSFATPIPPTPNAPTPDTQDVLPVRSAARGGGDQEMFLADGPIDQVPRPHYLAHARDAYAIYVVGTSMTPMYRPGQLLFVNPFKPPRAGNGIVITKQNGAVLIKEFVAQKQESLLVREYEPRQRQFEIKLAEVTTIHTVVGAMEPQ